MQNRPSEQGSAINTLLTNSRKAVQRLYREGAAFHQSGRGFQKYSPIFFTPSTFKMMKCAFIIVLFIDPAL
jgi:hypothetical protein